MTVVGICRDQEIGNAPQDFLWGSYFKPKRRDGKGEDSGGRTMNVEMGREEGVSAVLQRVSERIGAPMTTVEMTCSL